MKTIVLLGAAVIAGAVRYPSEGPQVVHDDTADQLVDLGLAEFEDEGDDMDAEEDDLSGLTVPELKKVAADEDIDLGDATKKADILAAIRAHRAAA